MDKTPLHWNLIENKLTRIFIFKNFVECVHFITGITPLAESMEHHPDIEIYAYKHVKVTLSTYDANHNVTEKDYQLAEQINTIFGS
jgi:4a-hydroxytetrahydrobiopterin dehydratase